MRKVFIAGFVLAGFVGAVTMASSRDTRTPAPVSAATVKVEPSYCRRPNRPCLQVPECKCAF